MRVFVLRGALALLVFILSVTNVLSNGEAENNPQDGRDLPTAVTIDEVLRLLRERSPRIAAERAQVDAAVADVITADTLPNPSISYGSSNQLGGKHTMFDGNHQQQSVIEAPLLIAGQRAARRKAAELDVQTVRARVQARYAELAQQGWQIFVKLLTGQEKVKVLNEAHDSLRQIKDIVVGRQHAGSASEYDVMRLTVEGVTVDTRLADAQAEVASSAGELGTLLGLTGWKPQAIGQMAPLGVQVNLEALWSKAEEGNPAIETARREELATEAAITRAQRDRWPVPVVSWGPSFTYDPYGLVSYAGVSVTIPLFDRGQGPIARAEAEHRSARLLRQAVTAETRAELESAASLLAKRRETLTVFERDALSRLPMLRQMAEDAYRNGKSSVLELLDASRSRTELQLSHLDLVAGVMEAEVRLLAASGLIDTGTAQRH
jgi:cobalt-zinc-cadmium efflux system outer membrane protein